MATKIDTVTAREKLLAREAPYWAKIRDKCHLGFRKKTSTSTGTWQVRFNEGVGKVQQHTLGSLDHVVPSRRYDEALKEANKWFDYRNAGGSSTSITVAQACQRYVAKKRDQKKESSALDLEGRYSRWVYTDQKLSNTLVMKLAPNQLYEWRMMLTKTPARLQDKSKIATKLRAPSSINREMASLKAALNQALKDGYCTSNTAWSTQLSPIANASIRRDCYLDGSQRKKLLESSPPDLANFIKALSLVPIRPGAMAQLAVCDYDTRISVITVLKDKAGRGRKLTLPPETAEFFNAQITGKESEKPIFARADGKFWNKDSWKGPFKVAVMASNLPVGATAYALRHSIITDLIVMSKLDLATVAKISGTSVAMIEKHYSHLLQDHVSSALSFLKV